MGLRALLAVVLSLLLVYVPVAPAASPLALGKINLKGKAEINGTPVPAETTVFSGDRITTEKQTALGLSMPGGDQVFLPSQTTAAVSRDGTQVLVALDRGAVAVVNRSSIPVVVQAHGIQVLGANPAGSVYEVALSSSGVKVMSRKGTALVRGSNRTAEVKEGTTVEATPGPAPVGGATLGPLLTVVLVVGAAAGITGLALGIQALQRAEPQNCVVVSPNAISCP